MADGKHYRASLRNCLAHKELGPPCALSQITFYREHSKGFISLGDVREDGLGEHHLTQKHKKSKYFDGAVILGLPIGK